MSNAFTYKSLKVSKLHLTMFLLICLFSSVKAHNGDPSNRLLTPKVGELARFIVRDAENDLEKAHLLYKWLADNISYDVATAADPNLPSYFTLQEPETVLRRGMAVCQGYANTYDAMAEAVDLTSFVINGYARADVGEPLEANSWNSVDINGRWILIDVTWGAGGLLNGLFKKDYNDDYFDATPITFIRSHLPDDPIWQLIGYIVPKDDFLSGSIDTSTYKAYDYNQAIMRYMTLSSIEQEGASARRALTYDPENNNAAYDLGLYYFDRSSYYERSYADATAGFSKKHEFRAVKDELAQLLADQEHFIDQSEIMFTQLLHEAPDFKRAAQENLRVLRSVKKKITFERRFLSEL